MAGNSEYERRLAAYEQEVSGLLEQVKTLEEEVVQLRRKLQDAPKRVRTLEERLGLRLLTRTTRSVSVTEAGERLLNNIGPHFDKIESEIAALSGMRDKPAGTVRITTVEHAAETILWPKLGLLAVSSG